MKQPYKPAIGTLHYALIRSPSFWQQSADELWLSAELIEKRAHKALKAATRLGLRKTDQLFKTGVNINDPASWPEELVLLAQKRQRYAVKA